MKNQTYMLTILLLLALSTLPALSAENDTLTNKSQPTASNPDAETRTPTFNKEFARNVIDYKNPNELMQAIIDNKPLSEIQRIIDSGIDINALDSNGNHVLHYAVCIYPSNQGLYSLLSKTDLRTDSKYNNNNLTSSDIMGSTSLRKALKNEIPFEPSMIKTIAKSNIISQNDHSLPEWLNIILFIISISTTLLYIKWTYTNYKYYYELFSLKDAIILFFKMDLTLTTLNFIIYLIANQTAFDASFFSISKLAITFYAAALKVININIYTALISLGAYFVYYRIKLILNLFRP